MKNYEKIDEIIEEFTPEELADYLIHNWRGYTDELTTQLIMQVIIEDREKKDARED